MCPSFCLLHLFLALAAWMEMPSAGISLCICVCLYCVWSCVFLWTAEVLEGDCCLCHATSLFIKLPASSCLRGGNVPLVFHGPGPMHCPHSPIDGRDKGALNPQALFTVPGLHALDACLSLPFCTCYALIGPSCIFAASAVCCCSFFAMMCFSLLFCLLSLLVMQ